MSDNAAIGARTVAIKGKNLEELRKEIPADAYPLIGEGN
jgi:hypothetical protein